MPRKGIDNFMMKKIIAVIFCIIMLAGFAGCGEDKVSDSGNGGGGDKNSSSSGTSYYMTYKGVNIKMNAKASTVIPNINETYTRDESASCAGQGKDVVYTYSAIEIVTYLEGDSENIVKVKLLDDSVMTPKNVGVGSSKDDIVKAYGNKYTESNGHLVYSDSNAELKFFMGSNGCTGVEFLAK